MLGVKSYFHFQSSLFYRFELFQSDWGQLQWVYLGPISWSPLRHNSVLTSTVKRRIYFMESVSKTYRLAEKFSANPDCFLLMRCQDTHKMAIGCRSRQPAAIKCSTKPSLRKLFIPVCKFLSKMEDSGLEIFFPAQIWAGYIFRPQIIPNSTGQLCRL